MRVRRSSQRTTSATAIVLPTKPTPNFTRISVASTSTVNAANSSTVSADPKSPTTSQGAAARVGDSDNVSATASTSTTAVPAISFHPTCVCR